MSFEQFGWVSYASNTRVSKFVDYLQEGRIYATKCNECGQVEFPPRAHCIRCLSTNFEWKELLGDCTLITYTKVDAAPSVFRDQAPYTLGLAEFSEGPKVFAWIDKSITEAEVAIGMKLKLITTELPNRRVSYLLTKAKEP